MANDDNSPRYNLRKRTNSHYEFKDRVANRREIPTKAVDVRFVQPADCWETQIAMFEDIDIDDAGRLMFYVTWVNGRKSVHEATELYKKCPQKVCKTVG